MNKRRGVFAIIWICLTISQLMLINFDWHLTYSVGFHFPMNAFFMVIAMGGADSVVMFFIYSCLLLLQVAFFVILIISIIKIKMSNLFYFLVIADNATSLLIWTIAFFFGPSAFVENGFLMISLFQNLIIVVFLLLNKKVRQGIRQGT